MFNASSVRLEDDVTRAIVRLKNPEVKS
jgi:hypothetical protein